jgi:NADH-quinone oxidoreductase subunit K
MHYKNFIFVLICLEMILLSINILFVSSSIFFDDLTGQIYSLLILSIAASESALGLTLFIVYYRLRGVITIDSINSLKG